jgi:murein L,D-transpeptidase YcbB/YkuD
VERSVGETKTGAKFDLALTVCAMRYISDLHIGKVLRDNPGWTPERIRAAMNGTTTQQVNLAHPIPVLILTVIVLDDGIVHFYDDIYGRRGPGESSRELSVSLVTIQYHW